MPGAKASSASTDPDPTRIAAHAGRRRRWLAWSGVAGLTLLASLLRFWRLDQPTIWGDESNTFRRVSGTYAQLLDALRTDGFTPLHYQLYWWIGQGAPFSATDTPNRPSEILTPWMMRLVPAIAGVLFVPTLYALARQLTLPRRDALRATLFAAVSAYLLVYSRDAKMYMPLWLFGTLHVTALLAWLRGEGPTRRLWWWTWVASGVATLGFHLPGLIFILVDVIVLLSVQERAARWRSLPGTLARLVALPWLPVQKVADAAGVVYEWSTKKPGPSAWVALGERSRLGRFWQRTGERLRMPAVLPFLVGLVLIGSGVHIHVRHYQQFFPRVYANENVREAGPSSWQATGISWVEGYNSGRGGVDLLHYTASAFLTGWEWAMPHQQHQIPDRTRRALKLATTLLIVGAVAGAFPWRRATRRLAGRGDPGDARSADWRPVLWITCWVVLPTYGFYLASIDGAVSPAGWLTHAVLREPPVLDALPLAGGDWQVVRETLATNRASLWPAFGLANVRVGIVLGLIGALTLGVWLCGGTTPQRVRRAATLAATLAIVVGLCVILYVGWSAAGRLTRGSVWMPRYLGALMPAVLIGFAVLIGRLPTRPLRWGLVALFVMTNLGQFYGRVAVGSEVPIDRITTDFRASQGENPRHLAFALTGSPTGGPGTGLPYSMPQKYYSAILAKDETYPDLLQGFTLTDRDFPRDRWLPNSDPADFRRRVVRAVRQRQPGRIVVWEQLAWYRYDDVSDPLRADLGDGWCRVEESTTVSRDHWTWREYNRLRRRVYERDERD